MAQARHSIFGRLSVIVIPTLAWFLIFCIFPQSASATGGSQIRPPYNTAEQNAYNSCVNDPDGSGSWQARRYGAIWVTNGSYYDGAVNVNAPDNSVAVRIRGSVFGCHHTSTSATYALNISAQGANGWRLTGLSSTSLYRGNSQGQHRWSTQGGEINATLNVSGLATNNQNGPATETIIIDLYRCFSTSTTSVTGKCYAEPIPVTVTRAAQPTTTLQGRVFNPASFVGYSGITIETCQGQVVTDGSGSFYKTANVGTGFCIRAVGGVPSGYAVFIRPWSEGYPGQSPGCPGFNSSTSSPLVNGKNYCAQQTYECQIAGQLTNGFCGVNYDRSWDGGYDIVLVPPSSFVITPTANQPLLTPDSETPTSVRFVSGITVTVTPPTGNGVKATLTRSYFIRRGASTIAISPAPSPSPDSDGNKSNGTPPNDPFNTFNYASDSRVLTGAKLGDRICVSLTTNPHRGTVDGSGNVVSVSSASNTAESCTPVANKPYLKVFGGSVWAGSKFNTSASACSSFTGGRIQTYARYNGGSSFGSSAQYAAQAIRQIVGDTIGRGFSSASQRVPPSASGPGYLTIANRFWNASTNWGGNMGGGRCLADFFDPTAKNTRFSTTLPDPGSSADINSNTLTNNSQYLRNGNFTLTASTPTSKRVTIFVDGDVSIPSNIEYCSVTSCTTRVYSPSDLDDPADSTDTDNIPYITIIARGNIYVGRNVETLSGLYIAQPSSAPNTGEIFTCSSGFARISEVERFTRCHGGPEPSTPGYINPLLATCNGGSSGNNTGKPLVVYGAFISRKTHFDRTNGTLRCASPYPEPFTWDKMAEKFYLTPELYLGQPVFRSQAAENYSGFGDAQSYSNLPPIF